MTLHRREFLKSTALLGAAAGACLGGCAAAKAGAPAAAAPRYDTSALGERIRAAGEKTGLAITSVETYTGGANLSFARVTADDGSEGWGQLSPFDADVSATILHRKIAPHVLGRDPADFEAIADRCIEANYKYPWSFVCRALCGVDTALWDLLARRAGKSVCALLGGAPRPIPVYGSSMSRTISPRDEGARMAALRDSAGFRAFKVRVGKVNGHDEDERPGRTEALIPEVRRAVGDGTGLLADGNSCYTPRRAIEVGRLLEAHGGIHFEEPCPYWELEWTAEVAAALAVPIAGGEQDNDLAQWRRMLALHAVDIAQPDVCYVGGLTRALRVAMLAADAGKLCVPHSANLSWVTVFTLHLAGVIPNAGPFVEFTIEDNAWTRNLYRPALAVENGCVAIPEGPGWGVTLDPAWLAAAARRESVRQ
ncbi:MAG TPA: mandelate racemase [Planctomycetes bacterium]|nr:mandelate racemase [Planctomycetota bacterium]